MDGLMTDQYVWVDSDTQFAECCEYWNLLPFISIDTEFIRTKTFYPKLGLLQVADDRNSYLIDPLQITDFLPFQQVLENPAVVKVLHACSEDAEIFHCCFNARARSVFDTQIAASFLGQGMSIGYANLVKYELGVDLPKDETRSDWLQRPLTDNQKNYAAMDVAYLHQIFRIQEVALLEQGRFDWVLEDSDRVVESSLPQDPERYYLKIRQAWQLRGARLCFLKMLASWRERLVQAKDIPRTRLVRDAVLYELAAAKPHSLNQLNRIHGLYPGLIRRYGQTILDMARKAEQTPRSEYPELIAAPLKIEEGMMLKKVREFVAELAVQLELPVELLARKKQLEAIVSSGTYTGEFQLTDAFTGWRYDIIGKHILNILTIEWNATNSTE